jgi:hypothetical protein
MIAGGVVASRSGLVGYAGSAVLNTLAGIAVPMALYLYTSLALPPEAIARVAASQGQAAGPVASGSGVR